MASRETQSLDKMIVAYLGIKKCEKTLKLFEQKSPRKNYGTSNCNSDRTVLRNLEAFVKYLKKKEVDNEKENDLGFEINFELYEQNTKVNIF